MDQHQQKVEKKMEDVNKTLPPLPESAKKSLVEYMPWISLVVGVIGVILAYQLWNDGRKIDEVLDGLGKFAEAFGVKNSAPSLGLTYWVSVALLAATSVMAIVAYQGLKAKSKARGWNILFYSAVLNVGYGIFVFLSDFGSAGDLVASLVGSAIGFYILFQIKSHYK